MIDETELDFLRNEVKKDGTMSESFKTDIFRLISECESKQSALRKIRNLAKLMANLNPIPEQTAEDVIKSLKVIAAEIVMTVDGRVY